MLVIYRSLDLQIYDHVMFWAACTVPWPILDSCDLQSLQRQIPVHFHHKFT